jgi:hypothetical protein
MIRLFVIGEKLAIDKTERATNLKQLEYGLDQYHDQVAYGRWSVVGAIAAHARDIYVPPPTRQAEACHASPEALAACDAERRRWELFKCNRKPIVVGVLMCRWDVD